MRIEVVGHKPGMFNGNAEAQSFYLVDVRHIFQDGVYHKVCAALRHQTAEGVQVR